MKVNDTLLWSVKLACDIWIDLLLIFYMKQKATDVEYTLKIRRRWTDEIVYRYRQKSKDGFGCYEKSLR